MIAYPSWGVKLQYILSGLERKANILDIHMHLCGFSFIFSNWDVAYDNKFDASAQVNRNIANTANANLKTLRQTTKPNNNTATRQATNTTN